MKRVVYHRLAASELIEDASFYERRRPQLGDRFLDAVEAALARVRQNPPRGRPETHGLRSYKVRQFPYRLFYAELDDRLWIVAVAHLSRRPGYWTRRLRKA